MNYIPGAVVSTKISDGRRTEGSTGSPVTAMRHTRKPPRGRINRRANPHVPDEVPPERGGIN